MLPITFVTLLLSAIPVFAAPVEERQSGIPANSIRPKTRYLYDVGTGAINCSTTIGRVFKSTSDQGHDITTLLSFEYPAASAGKTCQFGFYLAPSETLTGDKERLIDLFSSLAPAPGCTASWPPGNQRNQNLGRFKPVLGGNAAFVATYGTSLTTPVPCKAPGTVEAFELVGVYDNLEVDWVPAISGSYISYF